MKQRNTIEAIIRVTNAPNNIKTIENITYL